MPNLKVFALKGCCRKKEVLTGGQPSTEKVDCNPESQGFPNSCPYFSSFLRIPFLSGTFYKVSFLRGRDDVFGKHGLADQFPFGVCALVF